MDRMLGSIIGGVIGDAYGSPWEFKNRGTYNISPDMIYNENFDIPAGSFTDDSSMMLCLAASLFEKNGFDPVNQMDKYVLWWKEGYMSSNPKRGCFDIGRTTSLALEKYRQNKKNQQIDAYVGLKGIYDSGNGGIMRLAPIPIFFWDDVNKAEEYSKLSSIVTHASQECVESAQLMGRIIALILQGSTKEVAVLGHNTESFSSAKVIAIAGGEWKNKKVDSISTSGYVIDSLEAAIWAFWHTESFEDGMMLLAKLGSDVDTVCCIYGQIAGAYYGQNSIPQRWINKLQKLDLVKQTSQNLVQMVLQNKNKEQ